MDNGRSVYTYARGPHTDLLYQFRRPGLAERGSWPSPPAEHPASLRTLAHDVHRSMASVTTGFGPPARRAHVRLPSDPDSDSRVRLATVQHDAIAAVWK